MDSAGMRKTLTQSSIASLSAVTDSTKTRGAIEVKGAMVDSPGMQTILRKKREKREETRRERDGERCERMRHK